MKVQSFLNFLNNGCVQKHTIFDTYRDYFYEELQFS